MRRFASRNHKNVKIFSRLRRIFLNFPLETADPDHKLLNFSRACGAILSISPLEITNLDSEKNLAAGGGPNLKSDQGVTERPLESARSLKGGGSLSHICTSFSESADDQDMLFR